MQQHAKVTIDDNDDDDDDDVKQEVTNTIEKFIQNRHVQTLKYLRHVIDENRHLRLHIEHLKRRQDDPVPSPAIIDPIEPEEIPISEIPIKTPETPLLDFDLDEDQDHNHNHDHDHIDQAHDHSDQAHDHSDQAHDHSDQAHDHIDQATNTEGEDFEAKYNALNDELINIKKQHNINREEFQRELERVDQKNIQLEKDLKSAQQQITTAQKREKDKQIEIQNLISSLSEQKFSNETLTSRITKLEQTNRLLTKALTTSEQTRVELESQSEELRREFQQNKQKLSDLQIEYNNNQKYLQTSGKEIELLKEKLNIELNKCQELNDDNEELRENIKVLQQQLQEKILQEQQYNREKQSNSNFKEFIQVKRTLQACQQENEQLKIELKKLQIKLLNKNQ